MIEPEIRGPVMPKEYERLKRRLVGGEDVRTEARVSVRYQDRGFNNREVWLEYRGGSARMRMHAGAPGSREETVLDLAPGPFAAAVRFLAELGYKKGTVFADRVLVCRYGGAAFTLHEPENEQYHYEASIAASDPTSVKEAKQKLEKLARTFQVPIWTPLHMLEFDRRLRESIEYLYDYDTHGPQHFAERYGI